MQSIFNGVKVLVSPVLPVTICDIKLSDKVNVSDEFRYEFNEWLRHRFGKPSHMFQSNGMIFCSQEMYDKLKKEGLTNANHQND